jgi:hypothetical protein
VRCGGCEDRDELYNSKAAASGDQKLLAQLCLVRTVSSSSSRSHAPSICIQFNRLSWSRPLGHLKFLGLGCEMIQFIVVLEDCSPMPQKSLHASATVPHHFFDSFGYLWGLGIYEILLIILTSRCIFSLNSHDGMDAAQVYS